MLREVLGFKDGGRGHWQKHRQPLEAARSQETRSSSELPERTEPRQHHVFSPDRPMSDL